MTNAFTTSCPEDNEGQETRSSKSDASRAFTEDGPRKTHVGGQALIEGIMMRGRYNWVIAVREPSGVIYVEEHDFGSKSASGWTTWPFIRGCRALVESLTLGFKALEIAGAHAFGEEPAEAQDIRETEALEEDFDASLVEAVAQQETADLREGELNSAEQSSAKESDISDSPAKSQEKPQIADEGGLSSKEMAFSMVAGVILGVVLFIVAPAVITNLVVGEYDAHPLAWNIVDGILRVAVFVFYLWLIGRMEDIRRMFMYHGAEHKTIHCFEHGLELTPENARSFPRLHVRCGTAFLIMVMIIAIVVYTIIPVPALISAWGVPEGLPKLALVILLRILFLPLIAGISYEITVKWAGSHPENPLVRVILWPGMQMQYLTTNEPDDEQLACAIAAMKRVLAREEAEAQRQGMEVPTP